MSQNPLRGELVYFDSVRKDQMQQAAVWFGQSAMLRNLWENAAQPLSTADEEAWYDMTNAPNYTGYQFGVYAIDNDAYIGGIGIDEIDWRVRCGEIGIFIGDPALRGKGYGADAMKTIMRFGFRQLNLRRLQLRVFGYNTRAFALYQRLGFVEEARYRAAIMRDRQRHDVIVMGIFKDQ